MGSVARCRQCGRLAPDDPDDYVPVGLCRACWSAKLRGGARAVAVLGGERLDVTAENWPVVRAAFKAILPMILAEYRRSWGPPGPKRGRPSTLTPDVRRIVLPVVDQLARDGVKVPRIQGLLTNGPVWRRLIDAFEAAGYTHDEADAQLGNVRTAQPRTLRNWLTTYRSSD